MVKDELKSDLISKPLGIYSLGIKVTDAKSTIYISGLTSRDVTGKVVGEGDIKLQTETILRNLQDTLRVAGANLADVVKMTIFIRDMNQFKEIHEVRAAFFTEPYPACSMVEVNRLVSPEHLIEIEAIAEI